MRAAATRWALALLLSACGSSGDSPEGDRAEEEEDETGGEGDGRTVTLTEEGAEAARLVVVPVRRGALVRELELQGEINPDPDRMAIVSARAPARIARVDVRLGDRVMAGQPLALIESTELGRARGEAGIARARLAQAEAAFERQRVLREERIGSAQSLEAAQAELESARAEAAASRGALGALGGNQRGAGRRGAAGIELTSPIVGVVVARNAVLGQSVAADTALFTIADLSEVWAVLRAFDRDVPRIPEGAAVEVTTSADAEHPVGGRVSYVDALLDEATRTASVRVILPNAEGALRPGMFCTGRISGVRADADADMAASYLLVPREAIQRVGAEDLVFVRSSPVTFQARPVRVVERGVREAAIESGIREGDQVIGEGSLTLRAQLDQESWAEEDED